MQKRNQENQKDQAKYFYFGNNIYFGSMLRLQLDNQERCDAMGVAAKLKMGKGYSWRDYGDRLVSFLRAQVFS